MEWTRKGTRDDGTSYVFLTPLRSPSILAELKWKQSGSIPAAVGQCEMDHAIPLCTAS